MMHPIINVSAVTRNGGYKVPEWFPALGDRTRGGSFNFAVAIAAIKMIDPNCGDDVKDIEISVLCMAENKNQNVYTDIAAEVTDNITGITYAVRYYPLNGSLSAISGTGDMYNAQLTVNNKATLAQMIALLTPIVAFAIFSPSGRPMPFIESAITDYSKATTDDMKLNAMMQISKLIEENIVSVAERGVLKVQDQMNINPLNVADLQKASGFVAVNQGTPKILNIGGASTGPISKDDNTFGTVKKEFEEYVKTLNWSEEEEKLIPQFKDDFPVPEETLKFARRFLHSRDAVRPMVQFMWRGPTSYGKSTGVECLAALLHTPLLKTTCHPNMETSDFLADFVPDTSVSANVDNLPTFDDMSLDPIGAYYQLTGEYRDEATPQDCLEAYAAKASSNSSNTPRFKFVESNYVKALSRGYICEVQEASRIRNAGVLVGLNEFDRPGSVIPLLNGSYAKRHQNAIVIFTDNIGYASCRPLDPSVLRRMAFIVDSGELKGEQLFRRARYNTGCKDQSILQQAYAIYDKVMDYARKNDMMDEGSISATEYEMMVQCAMMEPNLDMKEIAKDCLVSKASSDPEMQETLMNEIATL